MSGCSITAVRALILLRDVSRTFQLGWAMTKQITLGVSKAFFAKPESLKAFKFKRPIVPARQSLDNRKPRM